MRRSRPRADRPRIRTPDQRLRVFVSSTLDELARERRAVSRAISALRLTPVMFELGARPHPPQELYQAYLAQSDIFVGLYWERYGQVSPGTGVSGLEHEFELSRSLPRLLYVKAPAPHREPALADLLSRIAEEASFRTFRTPHELGDLVRDDLATLLSERFGAARSPARTSPGVRPLPAATTPLVGREQAIREVAGLVGSPDARLVTLTGPGGVGKTRLALAVAEQLRDRFEAGTAFVSLAAVTDPDLVLANIGRAVDVDLVGRDSRLQALVERFREDRWLLVLDNLEQVRGAARDLDELLVACPAVAILATSRTALRLRAEHEYAVPPLPLPTGHGIPRVDELARSPAVALFVDRARAVRYDFRLDETNARAVREICRRLEGLPLAIELAAARIRLLSPDALLARLETSLDALGTATVEMPQRQHTLRATVEWSVDLLDDAERSLLETVAVFVDGWTAEAAAQVAGLDVDTALDLTDALVAHSLIYLEETDRGPRLQMLDTIREFVAERLAARPDAGDIRRRHAEHYRALAEAADRPLRTGGAGESAERLEPEAGNLAAAVRWYLDHDMASVPRLFRVLIFFMLRDRQKEARSWVDELLPAAESLDVEARAELFWMSAATSLEIGDDASALAARDRLAPLLGEIEEPYLHAVSQLAIAWTSPIAGDLDGALRGALASIEQLRGQDEPYWTAVAVATAATIETAVGRCEDAMRHTQELRELSERLDITFLATWALVQQGTLAVMAGRLHDASALLEDGLRASLASHSTPILTLCLVGFARLALAEGDTERAALVMGAVDGLRRRTGVRAWPILRPPEAEFVTRLRETLGVDHFDRVFAAGSELDEREALDAARAVADRS